MEKAGRLKRLVLLIMIMMFSLIFASCDGVYAKEPAEVVLEGNRVVYEQKEDVAYAEGDVRLRYGDLRVFADRVVYKTLENTVEAFAGETGQLTFLQGSQELTGSRMFFDMVSGEGKVFDAHGKYPAERGHVYANDGTVETIEVSRLKESDWLRSPVSEKVITSDRVYKWDDTALTSCPQQPPHYSLVSKKIVVLPGYRAIVKKPRLYLKEHYLFSYPFDYIMNLRKREADPLMPSLVYDGDKGAGLLWGSTFGREPFRARWRMIYWSEVDFEPSVFLEYDLGRNLGLYTHQEYSWDSERDEKRYRSRWGAVYTARGWEARVEWAEAQSVNVEKALGDTFKGVLWKSPEVTIQSPRYELPGEIGEIDVTAMWGAYEGLSAAGKESSADRLAGRVRFSGSTRMGDVRPFWSSSYWYYDYENPSATQRRTDVRFGVRWAAGDVQMVTDWRRRWVRGGSPLLWDRYSDVESLYHTLSFPLGKTWRISARGGYNLRSENLDEIYYRLVYDNNCCYNVRLEYRDDLVGDDDWAGIVFLLDAFPSHPFFLNTRSIEESSFE
ncbi:MAG: hypothetical protein ACLFN0_09955 [Thermovirgaceae bacterium]